MNKKINRKSTAVHTAEDSDRQLHLDIPEEPNRIRHEWRNMYTHEDLEQAARFVNRGQCKAFTIDPYWARAFVGPSDFRATIRGEASSYSCGWKPEWIECTCVKGSDRSAGKRRAKYGWYDDDYDPLFKQTCAHTAAVFLLWEKEHGPWEFTETEEEKRIRLEEEERERRLREEEEQRAREEKKRREMIQKEQELRKKQKKEEEPKKCPVTKFLKDHCEFRNDSYFDIEKSLSSVKTNLYEVHRAEKMLAADVNVKETAEVSITFSQTGEQMLIADMDVFDEVDEDDLNQPQIKMTRGTLTEHRCRCKGYYYSEYYYSMYENKREFCAHELVLLCKLNDYIRLHNPGDATDKAALRFFKAMAEAPLAAEESRQPDANADKKKTLVLKPLLIMDDKKPKLAFRIGFVGSKLIMLKRTRDLADYYEKEALYSPTKTVQIDFSKNDFTDESAPWLTFLLQRISDTAHINATLQSRNSWYSVPQAKVQDREILDGAMLDRFYDLAEGTVCDLQDKTAKGGISSIAVGHRNLQVTIYSEKICDRGGGILGIELKGCMPVIIKGSTDSYILDKNALSRISKEEAKALKPFDSVADAAGNIHFKVGKQNLAEFYYRVVPELTGQSFIDFRDDIADEVAPILPPEPVFTFRMDIQDGEIYCLAYVDYDGKERKLSDRTGGAEYRDIAQEERVNEVLLKFFSACDRKEGLYREEADEDALYNLLQDGIAELSRYGTVMGTDAFNKVKLRNTPKFSLGVSIDSGIMDLELISRDVSPEELLDILNSYKKKKKYHVLKNGDFVNFSDRDELDALIELTAGMDIDTEGLARGKMQLPAFRALYLDKLLEEHDALASSRDRTYRNLIKNFRTIKDSDYEVPQSMADTLRTYQSYGYKWLKTLHEAGFGGILADEMGLGKTVQAIALFRSWHDEGLDAPVLVVCPASLVYNWQEEINRFAPEISVSVIAGNAEERKQAAKDLKSAKKGHFTEVNIISYDLLRRDIKNFDKVIFRAVMIDEAQYIKNQKAAMTKAVKGVKASQRFALTGTPIENRLAELWSIFDFLMPGFLYDYSTFSERFETPIVKGKDKDASEKLKQMVRPFILRRLKNDVLKDLPEKLEEVRYARFDDEQRKVYDGQVVLMKSLIGRSSNSGEDKLRILAEITRLREICCDPSLILEDYNGSSAKRDACMELIESAMEGGHRMLLFSQFTSMLALLEEDLKERKIDYYKITGSTPKEQRLKLVHQFNEGDTPVFLISLKAGGTGLNLVGADVVIHYDPWWNLAVQNQATDRAHRIGQQKKVAVYRMIIKDTIEEKILALQEAKKDLAEGILSGEGKSLFELSTEELLGLLE